MRWSLISTIHYIQIDHSHKERCRFDCFDATAVSESGHADPNTVAVDLLVAVAVAAAVVRAIQGASWFSPRQIPFVPPTLRYRTVPASATLHFPWQLHHAHPSERKVCELNDKPATTSVHATPFRSAPSQSLFLNAPQTYASVVKRYSLSQLRSYSSPFDQVHSQRIAPVDSYNYLFANIPIVRHLKIRIN